MWCFENQFHILKQRKILYIQHTQDYSDYNCSTNFKISVEQMGIQVNKLSFLKQQYIDFSPTLDFWYFCNSSRTALQWPSHKMQLLAPPSPDDTSHIQKWIQIQNIIYQEAYILNMYNRHVLILWLQIITISVNTIPSIKYFMNYI
jgi:hypothetical protein